MTSTERTQKWRSRHPEKAARESTKRNRAWRLANPEEAYKQARARLETFRLKHPERFLSLRKTWARAARDGLVSQYIKAVLTNRGPLRAVDIPESMVIAKRAELKLKRTLKEIKP